jgi:hypothetical protein
MALHVHHEPGMKRFVLCLLALGACSSETPATPSLALSLPSYGGFDQRLIGDPMAVGPGAILNWQSGWSGTCQDTNWLDDTSEACDTKTYQFFLSCAGDDCTAEPAAALTDDGVQFAGFGSVVFSAAHVGSFNTTVTIAHGTQVVTQTQPITVVQPDSLVLECSYYEVPDNYTPVACPTTAAPYVAGAVYIFYVYAKQGSQLVDVVADYALDGFTVQPDSAAATQHNIISVNANGAGDYAVHASAGALTADYAITIQ